MKISFVIPCYNSEKTIGSVVGEIEDKMRTMEDYQYEIILVNDASPDDTYETISAICENDNNVVGVDLVRNFGQHAAVMAGIKMSTGDVVVCLDDDGQTPANEVDKLIAKIEEGYDAVYARYSSKQHSAFRNWGSSVNERMTEWILDKPKDLYVSSYFAVRRVIADEMLRYENAYPYLIGLVLRSTRKICNVDVNHRAREEGTSGYSLKKLIGLWMNGFTAFSVKPLRAATFAGVVIAMLGFVYTIYVLINKIFNAATPLGWSSIVALLLLLGGTILFVLGIIGEYIGRIYICINNSPQYVVREIRDSRDHEE